MLITSTASSHNWWLRNNSSCTSMWLQFDLNSASVTSFFSLTYFSSSIYYFISSLWCNTRSQSWSVELWVSFLWLMYIVILLSSSIVQNSWRFSIILSSSFLVVVYLFWVSISLLENNTTGFWYLVTTPTSFKSRSHLTVTGRLSTKLKNRILIF